MIGSAVAGQAAVRHVDAPVQNKERAAVILGRGREKGFSEGRAGADVHGPPAVDGAGVHVQRVDQVLGGSSLVGRDHGVKEQRSGSEIHDRRAGNTQGVDVAAELVGQGNGRADVPGPEDRAIGGIERINIVGLRDGDDHRRTAGPVLDVQRLGVDRAADRAVERQVPRETGRRGRREGGLEVQSVP